MKVTLKGPLAERKEHGKKKQVYLVFININVAKWLSFDYVFNFVDYKGENIDCNEGEFFVMPT